jgi:hypothetical protein
MSLNAVTDEEPRAARRAQRPTKEALGRNRSVDSGGFKRFAARRYGLGNYRVFIRACRACGGQRENGACYGARIALTPQLLRRFAASSATASRCCILTFDGERFDVGSRAATEKPSGNRLQIGGFRAA